MTEATQAKIPLHLRKYTVDQNYDRYTAEDQAVWRHIMRALKVFLSTHAHSSYVTGLERSGISTEQIPRIDDIDQALSKIGWGAVPVSGFIPPAAFMEFQSIGVLPIASDMRTVEHLEYTPAPDIVHEAAGHAPILLNPEYAAYLLQYGEVARHSILNQEDLDQYEAIRLLSDIKEDPRSTPAEIAKAETRLSEVNRTLTEVSEAALLSRMNWWTAEYGLIGDLKNPKIFGAGLLSSLGESRACLDPKVRKLPLTVDCVDYTYDITEMQPQLFVTENFAHLGEVLEQLAKRLAYRRGGLFGLTRAKAARTVNTVALDSGLQISGVLEEYLNQGERIDFVRFSGACQLSVGYRELLNQGVRQHPQGFSSPIGRLRGFDRDLHSLTPSECEARAWRVGQRARLEFQNGIVLEGELTSLTFEANQLVILSWKDCRVNLNDRVLFDPAWGTFDMAVGTNISSVFGGPADRSTFPEQSDFTAARVPARQFNENERRRQQRFADIRTWRESATKPPAGFQRTVDAFLSESTPDWLAGLELLELAKRWQLTQVELALEHKIGALKSPS